MSEDSTVFSEAEEVDVVEAEEAETEEVEADDAEMAADAEADETDLADQTEEEDGEEDEEAEVELDEFDFGGTKLQVPKGSVPEELRDKIDEFAKGTWSDYTRKSQEVSERAKVLEQRAASVDKIESYTDATLAAYSKGLHAQEQLEQLSQVDLSQLWQSDPDRARHVESLMGQHRAELQQSIAEVNSQETQLTKAREEHIAAQREEGERIVEKQIKGFKESRLPAVIDYVVSQGMDREVAMSDWALNPPMAIMADKALRYDEMQAKAKKPAPKKQAKTPVKPMKAKGTVGKGGLDLVADADNIPIDEWMSRRNKQARG